MKPVLLSVQHPLAHPAAVKLRAESSSMLADQTKALAAQVDKGSAVTSAGERKSYLRRLASMSRSLEAVAVVAEGEARGESEGTDDVADDVACDVAEVPARGETRLLPQALIDSSFEALLVQCRELHSEFMNQNSTKRVMDFAHLMHCYGEFVQKPKEIHALIITKEDEDGDDGDGSGGGGGGGSGEGAVKARVTALSLRCLACEVSSIASQGANPAYRTPLVQQTAEDDQRPPTSDPPTTDGEEQEDNEEDGDRARRTSLRQDSQQQGDHRTVVANEVEPELPPLVLAQVQRLLASIWKLHGEISAVEDSALKGELVGSSAGLREAVRSLLSSYYVAPLKRRLPKRPTTAMLRNLLKTGPSTGLGKLKIAALKARDQARKDKAVADEHRPGDIWDRFLPNSIDATKSKVKNAKKLATGVTRAKAGLQAAMRMQQASD